MKTDDLPSKYRLGKQCFCAFLSLLVFHFSAHHKLTLALWKCIVPMKYCSTIYSRLAINFLNHFKCFCGIKTGFPAKINNCTCSIVFSITIYDTNKTDKLRHVVNAYLTMNFNFFGNNQCYRTTDMGENVAPNWFFGFHSAGIDFFEEKISKPDSVRNFNRKGCIHFCRWTSHSLKNGHDPQKLFECLDNGDNCIEK